MLLTAEGGAGEYKLSQAVALRDVDLARLKSLGSKITDEELSVDEIEAVTNFLLSSVPQINEIIHGNQLLLTEIVKKSGVMTLKKRTPEGEKAHADDYIFRKGKVSNSCIVILQGKVKIIRSSNNNHYSASSKHANIMITDDRNQSLEEEASESFTLNPLLLQAPLAATVTNSTNNNEEEEICGPWTAIGAEALSAKEGTYVADFSAYIESEYIRFVRITTYREDQHSNPAMHRMHHPHYHHASEDQKKSFVRSATVFTVNDHAKATDQQTISSNLIRSSTAPPLRSRSFSLVRRKSHNNNNNNNNNNQNYSQVDQIAQELLSSTNNNQTANSPILTRQRSHSEHTSATSTLTATSRIFDLELGEHKDIDNNESVILSNPSLLTSNSEKDSANTNQDIDGKVEQRSVRFHLDDV
jgi:hypothetical protein